MRILSLCVSTLLLGLFACSSVSQSGNVGPTAEDGSPARRFSFEYQTTVSGFPAEAKQARIWLPLPSSDEAQTISDVKVTAPVPHVLGNEKVYGNRLVYVELAAPLPESLPITVSMQVQRKEVSSVGKFAGLSGHERLLAGDRFAPLSAEARARGATATAGRTGAEQQARGIYDRVLTDVAYDKSGQGWGRGDLSYVCDVGRGNCSDFHTLFIAMARTKEIPSVFEIGFPLPAAKSEGTIGGYHCWAWYHDDDGHWRPIDASEADKDPTKTDYFFGTICANRVAFSRGRDLILDPPQSGEPLNFLIYPYVEVDGKADVATVEKAFSFRNASLGRETGR